MRSWIEKLEQENNEHQREILRLKSLNRRAAEEIRVLDDILIDCVENNKVPKYDEKDPMFAGFSSINLLNRLDAKTSGGYIENYPDLCLKLKELDGWYVDQECACEPTVSKMETTAICDACGKKCDGTEKKTITTKQLSGVVMCEECSGGNTTERVEEHTPECKWHKDWHACDCGAFDK
jgi:hypothetical protein